MLSVERPLPVEVNWPQSAWYDAPGTVALAGVLVGSLLGGSLGAYERYAERRARARALRTALLAEVRSLRGKLGGLLSEWVVDVRKARSPALSLNALSRPIYMANLGRLTDLQSEGALARTIDFYSAVERVEIAWEHARGDGASEWSKISCCALVASTMRSCKGAIDALGRSCDADRTDFDLVSEFRDLLVNFVRGHEESEPSTLRDAFERMFPDWDDS